MSASREIRDGFQCNECATVRAYGCGSMQPKEQNPVLGCETCRTTTRHHYVGRKWFVISVDITRLGSADMNQKQHDRVCFTLLQGEVA